MHTLRVATFVTSYDHIPTASICQPSHFIWHHHSRTDGGLFRRARRTPALLPLPTPSDLIWWMPPITYTTIKKCVYPQHHHSKSTTQHSASVNNTKLTLARDDLWEGTQPNACSLKPNKSLTDTTFQSTFFSYVPDGSLLLGYTFFCLEDVVRSIPNRNMFNCPGKW
ncbi:unnamed protein product [Lactuca saligna]|uniref:Uncharacterized protein n=1 Tax=Lactuca saligna TaxID=75948 RepID=A0AA35VAA0_LACSI|nr:unnamed protein product [Lactuca saligna]